MHNVKVGDDAKNVVVQGILQNVPARANHGSEKGKLSSSAADGRRTESHGSARLLAGKAILSRASQDPVSHFSPSNPVRATCRRASTNLFISAALIIRLSRRQRLATLSDAAFLCWGPVELPGALGELRWVLGRGWRALSSFSTDDVVCSSGEEAGAARASQLILSFGRARYSGNASGEAGGCDIVRGRAREAKGR